MGSDYYVGQKDIGVCLTPGIKIWSNGMPLKADTYKSCSNRCVYCFARNLTAALIERAGVRYDPRVARTMDVSKVAKYFTRAFKGEPGYVFWAMRNRYYLELGTMTEVFQKEEAEMRVTWNLFQILRAFQIPLLINTKANLLISDERYFRLLADYPAPIIASITIIGTDDKEILKLEPLSPLASERFALVSRLKAVGIPTIIYCGPTMPGVTDVDLEGYVSACIESGAVGVHVRNFYLTGKLLQVGKWKKWVKENKSRLVRNGAGWKLSGEYMEEIYLRMQEIADRIDPRFRVVGIKSHWFRLNPYHGKIAMDWLPDPFKKGIIDFTAIPIMRSVRERLNDPQVLEWSRVGYDKGEIEYPESVPIRGGPVEGEGNYIGAGCYKTVGGNYRNYGEEWMDGWDWIKGGLWNGLGDPDSPGGFLSTVQRMFPISDNGTFVRDAAGDFLYCYVPPELEEELVVRPITDHPPSVPVELTTDLYRPTRPSGTSDKFRSEEALYNLGDRWD